MKKIYLKILSIAFIFYANVASALNLKMPSIFTNGMVLQRNMKIPIWGWAANNATVQVEFQNKIYTTVASSDGKWNINLDSSTAGGPYEMDIKSDTETITIKDILIGEVWLCSGQSNMALGFNDARLQSLYANELAS